MTETRGITFEQIQAMCELKDKIWVRDEWVTFCTHNKAAKDYSDLCINKNCPVWKGLKEGK
jgi:hypothetical protein